MAALTNYLESGILNHLFRQSSYIAPSTVYIGLNKSFISGNIESGITDEPNTGSYIRQQYISNQSRWTTPYQSGSATAIYNNYPVEFPLATENIGNISGIFISDASVSGNILFYTALTSPRNIREGDQFIIPSGSLKITFN